LAGEPKRFLEETMTQVGQRYQCSDCGCEIEVTSAGRFEDQRFRSSESASEQPIGGSATGAGSLRKAEAAGISTPGDFGSQGATGEGVFGTSGGGQRSTTSGRFGSSTASLRSGATGTPASQTATGERSGSNRPDEMTGFSSAADEYTFSCCCGQPMHKSSAGNQSYAARA
jgi:hypothetical protein